MSEGIAGHLQLLASDWYVEVELAVIQFGRYLTVVNTGMVPKVAIDGSQDVDSDAVRTVRKYSGLLSESLPRLRVDRPLRSAQSVT